MNVRQKNDYSQKSCLLLLDKKFPKMYYKGETWCHLSTIPRPYGLSELLCNTYVYRSMASFARRVSWAFSFENKFYENSIKWYWSSDIAPQLLCQRLICRPNTQYGFCKWLDMETRESCLDRNQMFKMSR